MSRRRAATRLADKSPLCTCTAIAVVFVPTLWTLSVLTYLLRSVIRTTDVANWLAQAARDAGKPLPGKAGLSSAEREELVRLRRELRQVKMERDILAKATAWFARKSDAGSSSSSNP